MADKPGDADEAEANEADKVEADEADAEVDEAVEAILDNAANEAMWLMRPTKPMRLLLLTMLMVPLILTQYPGRLRNIPYCCKNCTLQKI